MKSFVSLLVLALIFLAGCQKQELPVDPQNDFTSVDKKSVPFKMSFEGLAKITMPPNPECGAAPLSVVHGSGYGTHLGNYTGITSGCIIPDQTMINGIFVNGKSVITAANGDKLFADWTGSYETDIANDLVSYQMNLTITGGTGRFTGAEGEIVIKASAPYGGPGADKALVGEGEARILFKNLKPIQGYLEGSSDNDTEASCSPGFTGRVCNLEGRTNLGYSSAVLKHCNAVTSMEGGVLQNGTATLITPDGEIYFSYTGIFVFDTYPPTCATFPGWIGKITGGTGKFLNASGTVIGTGLQTFTPSGPTPLTIDFKGWLIQ